VSSRFASNLVLTILSPVLVTTSLTLSLATVGWLSLGFGCATVVVTLVAFAFHGRGPVQRSFDVMIALVGGWTIVAARTVTGPTLRWLSFSEAAAVMCLAVAGLIAHEVLEQREIRVMRQAVSHDGQRVSGFRQLFPDQQATSRRAVSG
jgi:hypothetical protein